ncbi:MAG: RHS repeat-associated core domain-containing protein, partial [Desulfobacteraceae bacterium]
RNLIYEDNGNLTIGYDFSKPGEFPERRLAYNAENMPLTLEYEPEGGAVTAVAFTYDGDGRRVKKESGGDTVIYVDATYEIRNGQPVKYIFAGNQRVAKVVGSTVQYYHKDHLGSSAIVTDTSGNMLESLVYEAYGQPRATCAPSSGDMAYTYTDQEWDAESGLYNYDARLYDPVLGRFLSADSVVPDWYNPQAFNRYSYALNNPLAFLDPNGHAYEDALRVWNSFVTNPKSAKYGLPKQAGMFSRRIKYTMPFTDQFRNRLAYMDSKGVDVTQLSHEQLGQQYHQEVIEQISIATEAVGAAASMAASRGAASNAGSAQKSVPKINSQKQAGHIPGTPQYKNRLKVPGKKTSAFFGKESGNKWTQKAWKEGTSTADPNIKILKTDVSVGTGPNGGMQKQVRVVMDGKGQIHGTPWGPEF